MKNRWTDLLRDRQNPAMVLLVWIIRGYQTFISPLIPGRCKYYPSCSQYAVDALRQYGFLRGTVLAGWRLLRCNPLSYGGYDPVERQTLFRSRDPVRHRYPVRQTAGKGRSSRLSSAAVSAGRRSGLALVTVAVVALVLLVPLSATSCSLMETTTTTGGAATSVTGGTTATDGTTASETTTTTVEEEQQPGSFDRLSKPLQAMFFAVLEFFHENLRVSWSWAIVLLTVVVRIVLLPLMWRQMKSMRRMQALQPHLKALQAKYKDNRQLLNQKMMEFYQQNNISPFSSCLPLLLQLPVFLGLFYMLRTAGRPDLDPAEWGRWASVFTDPEVGWLWIGDITQFSYILMFLYIASQFLASWQMARRTGGQQKIIAYVMPIVVGVFMFIYKWPAGLMIYWFTSNLWTIAQQFAAEKIIPVHEPVEVASEKGKSAGRPAGKSGVPQAGQGRPAGSGKAGKAGKTGKAPAKPGGKARPAGSGKAGKTGKAPAKPGKAPAKPGGKSSSASTGDASTKRGTGGGSAGESGGKTSGQTRGQQGKTAGGKGKRPDGGAGRPKSPGGA